MRPSVKKNKKNKNKIRFIPPQKIIEISKLVNESEAATTCEYKKQLEESQPFLLEFYTHATTGCPHLEKETTNLLLIIFLAVASSTNKLIPLIQFQTIDQALQKYTGAVQRINALEQDQNPDEKDIRILLASDSQEALFSFIIEELEELGIDEDSMTRCFFRVAVEVLGRLINWLELD